MAESSEEETDLPLSLSAKKRRYTKKSQISSDSDGGEPQTGSSKREVDGSKDRHDDLDSLGSEPSKTPCHLQTPRTSERLRRKRSKSFCVPSKEKVLEAISPGTILSSQKKIKALRPKKLVNNFLRERTSYVSRGEGCYDSDDSSMSDFINDDDDEDDYEDDSEESGSSDSNKKDSGICSTKRNVKLSKKKRLKGLSESNDEDNSDDEKKSVKKTPCNNATANASDSDENFVIRNKSNKRRKIIHCSDSDEDVNFCTSQEKILNSHKEDVDNDRENSGSDDSQNVGKNSSLNKASASLRPRSKRVQNLTQQHKDKNKKMFSTLLKKRQTAKLDLKERLETKQFSDSESDETSSSSLSCSEDECDPLQEAEAIFMHSSELEEDDDDRNFIDDDEQSSNEGMNSDCASQLLKLLDTFTGKLNNEDAKEFKTSSRDSDNTRFKRVRRRRKRNQRKVSQWRRIKIDDDSEDSDNVNNASDSNRHPPLHVAVLENNFDLVDKLIKEDSDCVYELGYRKRTALHLAALEERVDLVKLLLEHGADRTALDCYHLPAIAYAASGHPDSMRLLLDHASLKNISNSMNKNLQGMNLLHLAIGENRDGLECDNRARCLELLFSHDKKVCSKLLSERDARTFTPLAAGVYAGQHKCVQVLLKMGANALTFKTDDSGNLLHFAVECASHFKGAWECERDTSLCLRELLKSMKLLVNDADDHGFTPLMYACESGNAECVKVLLENGASVNCSDNHGTSGLHLAAISGDTRCVELLLNSGHQVDCVDRYGWPPLLYANFKAHESCVLALMKPKPEQVFILGGLLRRARNDLEKKRAVKVVKNVLVSLANHDAYYTVFNDFVRQNPEMLDENNYGLLQHTWRAILDFDNKRRWFLRKLSEIRGSSYNWLFESIHLEIDRENVLGSAINQMGKYLGHALRNRSLNVTFKDEPGICTGPKREFFACFCKDVIDPKRGLFALADDAQYSPVPNAYFAKCIDKEMPLDSNQSKATANQTPVTTGAKEEQQLGDRESELADEDVASLLSRDLTDEELLTVTQTGELSTVTANDRHGISSELADNQSMGSDGCRGQQETENIATCQPASEQAHLISSISREECMVVDQTIENDTHPCNMSQASQQTTWLSCMEPSSADQSVINLSLRSKLKQLRFVGRMIGFAVCQNLLLNLQLSKPFVKQILGIPLTHPDDLSSFDYELHRNAVIWVRENSVNELDLPFSVTALNPWNSKPATIELSSDADKKLTDDNKEEYVRLVSQLKLETLIRDEIAEFAGGLNEVIPRELLSLFTADEFSLLIGGVAKIDLDDWKKNTQYQECSSSDNEITWFWNVVSQLKEEEKALLMKFSTGSPCVPIGGFAALTGLLGPTKFTILKIGDLNKIPMASTCFNMLKLTSYSSEKHLKDKLLIAIRHGAEGFSFG